jgi:HTH-type transcriptional regulator/antitoxin HigA
MQQMNLKQKDLIPYIGNRSKVSELLNRKIALSLTMITKLANGLHLPLEALIQPPKRA